MTICHVTNVEISYQDWVINLVRDSDLKVGGSLARSADSFQMALESRGMLFEINGGKIELRGFIQLWLNRDNDNRMLLTPRFKTRFSIVYAYYGGEVVVMVIRCVFSPIGQLYLTWLILTHFYFIANLKQKNDK